MKNNFCRLGIAVVLAAMFSLCLQVIAQEADLTPSSLQMALSSGNVKEKNRAYQNLMRIKEIGVDHFRQELDSADFWGNTISADRVEGTSAVGLYVIQKLKIGEFVPQLVEPIDWSVDTRTYKAGVRRNGDARYGVVLALIAIAGPDVKKFVVKRLRVTTDAKQRLFCLHVLQETEGESLPFIVDKEIERSVFENEKANLLAAKAEIPNLEERWNHFLFTGKIEAAPATP